MAFFCVWGRRRGGRLRTVHTAENSSSNASMSCYVKIYDIIFPYLYYISSRK